MVLQRDSPLSIWGWADAGEKVTVRFKGKKYTSTADAGGKWKVTIPPITAGGPFSMEIIGANKITLDDVLIGDVWLCAGQSNMVHNMELHKQRYGKDIASANYPQLRQFLVPGQSALTGPAEDLAGGEWKKAMPENVGQFSVVAYFFGKSLYDKYQVPIGLINASVGGTPIEAWTSEEGLKAFPEILTTVAQNKDTAWLSRINKEAATRRQAIASKRPQDQGIAGPIKWYDPAYQPKNWHTMNIPGFWEDQGLYELNGIVWYRRDINIPLSMTGMTAQLAMGRIVDADEVYINGQKVGNKTYQYPQRYYDLAPGVLRPGKNTFVVRVTNYNGKGGFVSDKPYYLAAAGDTLDLKGTWQYRVGAAFPPEPGNTAGINLMYQPTALFNGMVAPYTQFPIKGAIWYQGESNAGRPLQYEQLLPALIEDWRTQWSQPDLPFLYAQLPNFMDINYLPSESNWAQLRESQRKALQVANTAMAVTIDLGEWNDIHPDIKKPIGDRLALAAQKLAYGEKNVVYSGPAYTSATVSGGKVTLHFNHTGSGLVSGDGEPLRWFALAGENKVFQWAEAVIEGKDVVLSSQGISNPLYVRYAWADNPLGANLFNKEGLPASPFEARVGNIDKLWYGKKAGVVLSYDDALEVHLDNVIPALDSLGFKGSFYLSAAFPGSKNRLTDWTKAAANGHELGNHTLYHPCDGAGPGRSWVSEENDLSKYNTKQIVREVAMTNVFLTSLDGKTERTFAYTCGDTATGEGSFIEAISDQFISMRGTHGDINRQADMDLKNMNCYAVDETNVDKLQMWAEKAKAENALLVLLFHGVGGGHNLNVPLDQHNDFLKYLKDNESDFWVTTLIEASKHSMQQKGKP